MCIRVDGSYAKNNFPCHRNLCFDVSISWRIMIIRMSELQSWKVTEWKGKIERPKELKNLYTMKVILCKSITDRKKWFSLADKHSSYMYYDLSLCKWRWLSKTSCTLLLQVAFLFLPPHFFMFFHPFRQPVMNIPKFSQLLLNSICSVTVNF